MRLHCTMQMSQNSELERLEYSKSESLPDCYSVEKSHLLKSQNQLGANGNIHRGLETCLHMRPVGCEAITQHQACESSLTDRCNQTTYDTEEGSGLFRNPQRIMTCNRMSITSSGNLLSVTATSAPPVSAAVHCPRVPVPHK